MSLFGNILSKLGLKKPDEAPKPQSPSTADTTAQRDQFGEAMKRSMPDPKSAEIPVVDVVSKLEGMAAKNPQELNWKVSIVDLLKLLEIDSSYEARVELAKELDCPEDFLDDSAQMNTWLHKTVLNKIAENGGNIPKELLD
jgi:hypothetical protein